MARNYFVERKSQPSIDQNYLETHASQNKDRGEELIKYAQDMREKFESNQGQGSPQPDQRVEPEAAPEQKDRRNSGTLLDMNLPEKEELLYQDPELDFKEYEDFLMINGEKLSKPFVEKPINAEDHEIKIYYSSLNPCGSGYNVLFRKTNDFSG